jgi:FUS-interacting serine-arginine-rich protein 1
MSESPSAFVSHDPELNETVPAVDPLAASPHSPSHAHAHAANSSHSHDFQSHSDSHHFSSSETSSVSLFVRNLNMRTSVETIRSVFSEFGEVKDVYVPRDYHTHQPRGFAYVQFSHRDYALHAIEKLNKFKLEGREIYVELARGERKSSQEMKQMSGDTGRREFRPRERRERRSRSRSRSRDRIRSYRSRSRSRSRSPRFSRSPARDYRRRDYERERRSYGRSRSRERERQRSREPERERFNDMRRAEYKPREEENRIN